MKKRKNYNSLLILSISLCSITFSNAQYLERQVIGSSGATFSNSTYQLEFTLGETAVGTLENGQKLTQGFQQSWVVITTATEPGVNELALNVYPNPTPGNLNIEVEQACEVVLTEAAGRIIARENLQAGRSALDIETLPAGTYVMIFRDGEKRSTRLIQKL